MEADERPPKIRKINHETGNNEQKMSLAASSVETASTVNSNNDVKVTQTVLDQSSGAAEGERAKVLKVSSAESPTDNIPKGFQKPAVEEPSPANPTSDDTQQLSKSQLKKLRKKEEWEAGRDWRKAKRKQKMQEKKARKRAAKDEAGVEAEVEEDVERLAPHEFPNAEDARTKPKPKPKPKPQTRGTTLLPITFVIDCSFDVLMIEKERISLGSQLTRAYSDNHRGPFSAHLVISSWNGLLKERFETVLSKHHENWRGVKFMAGDFVDAAEEAKAAMASRKGGGKMAGIFAKFAVDAEEEAPPLGPADSSYPSAGPKADNLPTREIVYLTSDSPHTLDTLKPHSTYIIGGLVDKNRHKGICYKTACERGVATAKLPISEYMDMQSRSVLATNHVVEIMVRYLECGNWGEAFLSVIPKRKGGRLKGSAAAGAEDEEPEAERDSAVQPAEEQQQEEEQEQEQDEDGAGEDASKDVGVTATENVAYTPGREGA